MFRCRRICLKRSTSCPTTGLDFSPRRRAKSSSTCKHREVPAMTDDAPTLSPPGERYAAECQALSAAAHARVLRDIPYGADPRQRMDIFLPREPGPRDLPVLLFMHGGGWT